MAYEADVFLQLRSSLRLGIIENGSWPTNSTVIRLWIQSDLGSFQRVYSLDLQSNISQLTFALICLQLEFFFSLSDTKLKSIRKCWNRKAVHGVRLCVPLREKSQIAFEFIPIMARTLAPDRLLFEKRSSPKCLFFRSNAHCNFCRAYRFFASEVLWN